MDYRDYVIDMLKRKQQLERAYQCTQEDITMLQSEQLGKRSVTDPIPITGSGANKYEDKQVNLLYRIDECKARLVLIKHQLRQLKLGYSVLDDYEIDILQECYVIGGNRAIERLCDRHHRERSTVYNDRGRVLDKLARAIYGVVVT